MHNHFGLIPSKKALGTLQTVGIIVVIVVALVAGSVYYYVSQNPFPAGTESTPGPTETPLITPTPTSSDSPTPKPTSSPTTTTPTSQPKSSTTTPTNSPSNPTTSPATPSASPTPPTATPTPVPTIPPIVWKVVDLGQAVLENLVTATVSGDGLTEIDLTLQLTSNESLELTIKVGTLFQAQSAGVQNMVVIENKTVHLKPPDVNVSAILEAACASMELDQPKTTDAFIISSTPLPGDLVLLLNSSAFGNETFRVKQFAIWTITDNPPRDGYVGLSTIGTIGSGPSDAEIAKIRALFVAAGITPEKYKALQ